uniref:DUF6534 domain-containing protein n=1 Tax=Mycena chlorophos TaxID=658473 RepID=A0ABQ0LNV4_MYCCL|nr:predicted protein [Mycena chlorophos]
MLITKLIFHAIETGAVTTIAAGVELGLFLTHGENLMHEAPAFLLGKLYSNVVLATLNGRSSGPTFVSDSTAGMGSSIIVMRRMDGTSSNPKSGRVQVDTMTEVTVHTDTREADIENKAGEGL